MHLFTKSARLRNASAADWYSRICIYLVFVEHFKQRRHYAVDISSSRLVIYIGILSKHQTIKQPLSHGLVKQMKFVLGGIYLYFPKRHVQQYLRLYVSVKSGLLIIGHRTKSKTGLTRGPTLLPPSLLHEGRRIFAACRCRQRCTSVPHHSSLPQATGPCCCRCGNISPPAFPRTSSQDPT